MSSPHSGPPSAPATVGQQVGVQEEAAQVAAELAESLGDVVYAFRIHPDYAFEYISPAVEALTGYPAAEYYAHPTIAVENTPEEYRAAIEEAYAAETGVVTEFTVPWVHRDGRHIWTQHRCRKQVRADGSVVILSAARDVTATVEAQQALSASQQMYRLLAENASDVVWRTNLDAVVEWVSPSITAVTGWACEEMVGTRIFDYVHPDDADRVRTATAVANEGGRVSFEAR